MKYLFPLLIVSLLMVSCTSSRTTYKRPKAKPFSKAQASRVMDKAESAPMRVFKINQESDSLLLRTQSEPVKVRPNDKVLNRFVDRLYSTVRDSLSLGVGIAAPQVGILKQIIWVQRFDKEGFPFEVYLNPKIVQYSKQKQDCLEGCLSIPERRDTTTDRAYAILIEYDQLDKQHKVEMVEGFTAVIFQHEIDHLNGILYLDHLEKERKDAERR